MCKDFGFYDGVGIINSGLTAPLSHILIKTGYAVIYKTYSNLISSNDSMGFVTISMSDVRIGQRAAIV